MRTGISTGTVHLVDEIRSNAGRPLTDDAFHCSVDSHLVEMKTEPMTY